MTSKEEELVKQEANLLMQIKQFKHPNIMQLDTYFRDQEGIFYLVINYEETVTL